MGSQHTSSFSSRFLASFSSFSRASSFRLLSLYSGVGVMPRRGGIETHLELFLVFPGFLLFLLAFELPLPRFPLRRSQKGALPEETWFATYFEFFLAFSSLLFFLPALEFLPSLFLLQWGQNDVRRRWESQRTSSSFFSSLAFLSSSSRSSFFRFVSFCNGVRITPYWNT